MRTLVYNSTYKKMSVQ